MMSRNFFKENNAGRLYSGSEVFRLAANGRTTSKRVIEGLLQAITIGASASL